ncbi:hypothetical protein CcCBS67573_g06670 [Chytriomyces confervae]|uniref:Uncharacterized protein n=1 Tax=Chytriomyces confervae TaxID=246404 RepID=A0A507F1A1_9FUNG|nr:hypothetical protein CcCBS67573_g06670 [Chytriomyces confervae]
MKKQTKSAVSISSKKPTKVVFGDDGEADQVITAAPALEQEPDEESAGAVNELNSDSDSEDGDVPEAVSIVETKRAAQQTLISSKQQSKSQKMQMKSVHSEREAKGRELNIEKQKKLVAAKDAKKAIDMSIFEEAELAASAKKSAVVSTGKRSHLSLESLDTIEPKKKKTSTKAKRIGAFTIVPIDVSLVKQKPTAPAVSNFQKSQLFGDRIQRKSALLSMGKPSDGIPPNSAESVLLFNHARKHYCAQRKKYILKMACDDEFALFLVDFMDK